jgi:hypothetical protein
MATHTKDSLGGSGISQVLNLPLAVSASEATSTERLIGCQDSEIFDLIATSIATVRAIIADK